MRRYRVGVVVKYKGKILLCLRSKENLWGLPGGKVRYCESIVEAAVRETEEESGLVLKKENLKFVGLAESVGGPDRYMHYAHAIFEVEMDDISDLKIDGFEMIDAKFVDLNDTPQNMYQPTKDSLEMYREGTGVRYLDSESRLNIHQCINKRRPIVQYEIVTLEDSIADELSNLGVQRGCKGTVIEIGINCQGDLIYLVNVVNARDIILCAE